MSSFDSTVTLTKVASMSSVVLEPSILTRDWTLDGDSDDDDGRNCCCWGVSWRCWKNLCAPGGKNWSDVVCCKLGTTSVATTKAANADVAERRVENGRSESDDVNVAMS